MGSWRAWGHTAAGQMASVVSAVTHPAHPWGFAWGGPAPALTQDSWAVAALWQCHRQGGDARLSQQLGCLSEAGRSRSSSSSCFPMPDRPLKFKARLMGGSVKQE